MSGVTVFVRRVLFVGAPFVVSLGFASMVYGQAVNLIPNGSLETAATGAPASWSKVYWGSPTPTFTYPGTGNGGTKGATITYSANSTGDARWQPTAPSIVTSGATYIYSAWYNSSVATEINAEYTNASGAITYAWLADVASSGGVWKQITVTFTVPTGMTKAVVYQLIDKKGSLSIDDISLVPAGTTPPPPPPPAPTTPTLTLTAAPTSLTTGQTSTLTWSSTNATSCTASSGWSGAKTTFGNQLVAPTVTTTYTLSCSGTGGSISKSVTVTVTTVPPPPPPNPGVFTEGMVSLSFDDSWLSQYTNALPVLQSAGIKGTFYLTTEPVQGGWSGYMTPTQIIDIGNKGHEIAGHTVTHAHLTQLSSSQVSTELGNSKTYLQNLTGRSVTSFAYPYGELSATVKSLVQSAGYTSARGTDEDALNTATSDKYNLKSSCIESNATFAQVKAQIDKAKAQKQWYILCIHEVKSSPGQYDTSLAVFQQIVTYIKSSGIKTVTLQQGRALMAN